MLTDYKIHRKTEKGDDVTVVARFYEGEIATENELNFDTGKMEPVTRYRRSKKLKEVTYNYKKGDDIVRKLNSELKKDATRTPIAKQK